MSKALKLLVVEDSEDDARLVIRMLRRGGFEAQHERVESAAAMAAALQRQAWDAVVSDYNLPGFSGLDALRILRSTGVDIPFILISGTVGEEIAVDALKAGANDYIIKINLSRLASVLERELKEAAIRADHRQAQHKLIESEAGLHRAQIMARLAHVITGADGAFESWSDSLPELIGVEPAQVPGNTRQWLKLIHPEDRGLVRTTSIEAGRRGTRMSVEYRIRHGDGAWIHVSQVMEPIDAPADAAGGRRWFSTLQDISREKQAAEALRASDERHRAMFEQAAVGIVHTSLDGRLLMVNPKFADIAGYTREEASALDIRDITHPDDIERSVDGRSRMLTAAGAPYERELRLLCKDGTHTWAHITTSLVRAPEGQASYFISVIHDISEHKQDEERIRRLNRVYAVLSGINALIVRVRDRDELFKEACRVAVDAGGFRMAWLGIVDREAMRIKPVAWHGVEEDFIRSIRLGLGDATRGIAAQAVMERRAMIAGDMTLDPRVRLKKEALARGFHSLAILPLIIDEEAVGLLALYAHEIGFFDAEEMKLLTELAGDISFALDHIEKANKLDYLAYYDALTGLANRTLFHERLSQYMHAAQQRDGKLALLLADVERFKTINDSLGRQAGDELLKQLAGRLGRATDPGHVARIGNDHFAVVLPEIRGRSQVGRSVERIWHDCFAQPFRVGDTDLRVSAKAGIALFPTDGDNADRLFASAEAALQKARETGEQLQFHSREMTARVAEQLALENRLRQALPRDEFVLHYQPKVELETRRIVGAEALMRWQSPELGLVAPLRFIPLMEETGLILEVGAWALATAAGDHSRWVGLGLPAPRVAVNVSAVQLRRRDFVATVEQALKCGAAPTGIDLEITESLIMEDVQGSIAKLRSVHGLGVNIAIDDFGTGYSSLGYLARLPVQSLKIDRSFIITMLNDPDTMTLVQTIISLAHSLRLKVVAESVETEEQAKILRLLRCDEMQGYLFSKPVPFDQMTALLAHAESD